MERSISFWRRIGAHLLDNTVLTIIAAIVGTAFKSFWVQNAVVGSVAGSVLVVAYFAVLNSRVSGGQTPGKFVLKIRVVDRNLQALSLGRSSLRALVLQLPVVVFLWHAVFPSANTLMGYTHWLAYFFFSISLTYLFLFNRHTRQSLHDVAVGSFVVHWDAETVPAQPIWRGHIATPLLILLLSVMAAKGEQREMRTEAFRLGQQVSQSLNTAQGVLRSGVVVVPRSSISGSTALGEIGLVKIDVLVDSHDRFRRSFANELSKQILDQFPDLRSADVLEYKLHYGYRLGTFEHWDTRHFGVQPGTATIQLASILVPEG